MERDVNRRTPPPAHIGTAEMSLAMWLRNGRAQKRLSLDDVARITKIQPRILERLEAGKLDGLPAEVFVRGFVRSFARCVGLDEAEALRRYAACATPVSGRAVSAAPAAARAMIEAMGDLAPTARGKSPAVLRDEPTNLAAGSMEIATDLTSDRVSEPSIEITFGSFGSFEEPAADVPVEITFAEASEVISIDHISVGMVAPVASEAETVVVAPPADMNLSADSAALSPAVPPPSGLSPAVTPPSGSPTEPTKKKRTRRAADSAAAPKRRRSKVANGTPSEPTAVIAAEIDAEIAADNVAAEIAATGIVADTLEPIAPKRRRKPRGSVQPPIAEAEAGVDATVVASTVVASTVVASTDAKPAAIQSVATESDTLDVVAADASRHAIVDAAGEISTSAKPLTRRVEMIDDTAAIDDVDAPFATALEFAAIGAPAVDITFDSSLIDTYETHDDSTTRFERSDDMQLSDEVVEQIESTWTPRMPSGPSTPGFPTGPITIWRRSAAAPSLVAVIDDADPDGAERVLEDRRGRESRRTFLPPILMDRDGDRSGRQGGLTLAVIILLIAATLTLSYLMRRPSAGGDGVTQLDDTTEIHSIG